MARLDPHSYADADHAQTGRIELKLRVDFGARTLRGACALHFRAPGAGPLDLDTRGLSIEAVTDLAGAPLPYQLHAPEPVLGARLRVELPPGTAGLRVLYQTSPEASALQWLDPAQTAGGVHPFLFSQCQPIHARSLVPLQDTPRVRITARASFTVPSQLRTLMGAAALGREPAGPGESTDAFEMPQAIPPYLLAFAVGDLTPRQLSVRSAVWAERSLADAAAWEFERIEEILLAAEELFGPYDWDRFDVLVMPPSFPYGGMENPRLTFVTPSLLAGDRSLVNVIAHELAHAWTGNLVTNASANDFWLNEGFTVYAERRILEATEGREAAELHASIGRHDLGVALARFADRPQLTRLRNDLQGVDPDDAFSTVPYEKGYLLLRRLEELAGRARWDSFLARYLAKFRFQSITTQDFLDLLDAQLPGLSQQARALEWIDQPGLPADAPEPDSQRLRELSQLAGRVEVPLGPMTPTEILVYLQALPVLTAAQCEELDRRFGLAARKSLELRHTFVLAQLRAGAPGAVEGARRVLAETGRMKYLRPLFGELFRREPALAREIYQQQRGGYHPIARAAIEGLLRTA